VGGDCVLVHIWVSSCTYSCNYKYLLIVTQLYEHNEKYKSKIVVYDNFSDTKIGEIGSASSPNDDQSFEKKKKDKN